MRSAVAMQHLVLGGQTSGGGRVRSYARRIAPALVMACAVLVTGACAVVLSGNAGIGALPAPSGQSGASGIVRLRLLPLAAQAAASTALGSREPSFAAAAVGGGYRLDGGGVRADLAGGVVRLAANGGSLSLAPGGVGRGGQLAAVGRISMSAHANRVVLAGAGLREWYAAGPLGIEQGFAVPRRPTGARGPLTVALRLGGSLRAKLDGSEALLSASSGRVSLRYGGLVATDATGRRLSATLEMRGRLLLLAIDDRAAAYPVRIDPFIESQQTIPAGETTGFTLTTSETPSPSSSEVPVTVTATSISPTTTITVTATSIFPTTTESTTTSKTETTSPSTSSTTTMSSATTAAATVTKTVTSTVTTTVTTTIIIPKSILILVRPGIVSIGGGAHIANGGVIVTLTCTGATAATCDGKLTLNASVQTKGEHELNGHMQTFTVTAKVTLGSARYDIAGGTSEPLDVKLTAAVLKLLQPAYGHKVIVFATATPTGAKIVARTVTLIEAPVKPKPYSRTQRSS
ncbi:MAG: hypothetical protein ACLP01_16310 [Solirubrobacteraceae bacterium]